VSVVIDQYTGPIHWPNTPDNTPDQSPTFIASKQALLLASKQAPLLFIASKQAQLHNNLLLLIMAQY
jgi:hypothetical protein